MQGRRLILGLALSAVSASAGTPGSAPPEPPFEREAYIQRHGRRAFEERVLPIIAQSPRFDDGTSRYAFGDDEGESAGTILDRSLKPPRSLSLQDVELLIELALLERELARPGARRPEVSARLKRMAGEARRRSYLFEGAATPGEVAGYLAGLAEGADDRVGPAAPPQEGRRGADAVAADGGRRPTRSLDAPTATPSRLRAFSPSPPPPASEAESSVVESWTEHGSRAFEAAAGALMELEPFVQAHGAVEDMAVRAPRRAMRALRLGEKAEPETPVVDPDLPPAQRLARLEKLLEESEVWDLRRVLDGFDSKDLFALPRTRRVLIAYLGGLGSDIKEGEHIGWENALDSLGRALKNAGWMEGETAALYAERAARIIRGDPKPSVFAVSNIWSALEGAEGLDERHRARLEAAEEAVVTATLDALLADSWKEIRWDNAFSAFDMGRPPFKDAPQVPPFMKKILSLVPKASGDPYRRASLIGTAVAVLRRRGMLDPESAITAVKGLEALPLSPDAGNAESQILGTDLSLYYAYRVLSEDQSPGHAVRLNRFEVARRKISELHLPQVLASLKTQDLEKKAEAAEDLGRFMFRDNPSVRAALVGLLKGLGAEEPSGGYQAAPRLFAAVVKALGAQDRDLSEETLGWVSGAAERLGILDPPAAGAPAADWAEYLRGVEVARNAIRASTLGEEAKGRALDEFDARFAAAYDKGREPAEPEDALKKLLEVGPQWLNGTLLADGALFNDDDASASMYESALRETAALFLAQASRTNPEASELHDAALRSRLEAMAGPKAGSTGPDIEFLRGVLTPEELRRVEEGLRRIPVSEAPPSSAHLYLQAYRLVNLRAALEALPEDDPKRRTLAEALALGEETLVSGLERLAALPGNSRFSGVGGSRDHVHARMTALLALPEEKIPERFKRQAREWLDAHGPLSATYRAFPENPELGGENLARGGAGRNVMLGLFGYRVAGTPEEKARRLEGLEASLNNFARHEAVLRATMHRYRAGEHPHFYEDVGSSGNDGLAPYYYPSAISRVLESFRIALNDPAVRADEARLERLQESYATVRNGLLREFDASTGLREPLRRDLPWFYTLLGTAAADLAAWDAADRS